MVANSNNVKYIVRLYDGFDNEWFDICEPTTYENAKQLYNEKTKNGTVDTNFRDFIDYYSIFEVND